MPRKVPKSNTETQDDLLHYGHTSFCYLVPSIKHTGWGWALLPGSGSCPTPSGPTKLKKKIWLKILQTPNKESGAIWKQKERKEIHYQQNKNIISINLTKTGQVSEGNCAPECWRRGSATLHTNGCWWGRCRVCFNTPGGSGGRCLPIMGHHDCSSDGF